MTICSGLLVASLTLHTGIDDLATDWLNLSSGDFMPECCAGQIMGRSGTTFALVGLAFTTVDCAVESLRGELPRKPFCTHFMIQIAQLGSSKGLGAISGAVEQPSGVISDQGDCNHPLAIMMVMVSCLHVSS